MISSTPPDPDAFGELVQRHQRRLFGLVLMVVRDPEGAEEVAQDAFVRAYKNFHRYDERRPFYPWLATIAVRLANNWLRSRNRRRAATDRFADDVPLQEMGDDPSAGFVEDERDRLLWNTVAALPQGERSAVFMHYRQEMTVAEVAAALGVSQGTVKSFLYRARQKLRRSPELASAFGAPVEA